MSWASTGRTLVLGLAVSGPLWAGSNLDSGVYPDPACGEKPAVPSRPEQFESEAEIQLYNEQVTRYNARIEAYFACIQAYVDNAAEDIKLIKSKAKAAVEAANR